MSAEGRCASCRFWRQPDPVRVENDLRAWREMDDGDLDYWIEKYPPDQSGTWGWCDLIALPESGATTSVAAYVEDGSDYRATLNCRADFGCTLHEVPR